VSSKFLLHSKALAFLGVADAVASQVGLIAARRTGLIKGGQKGKFDKPEKK